MALQPRLLPGVLLSFWVSGAGDKLRVGTGVVKRTAARTLRNQVKRDGNSLRVLPPMATRSTTRSMDGFVDRLNVAAYPRGMSSDWLARLRPADLLRLLALDAELRGLPPPFVDAIRLAWTPWSTTTP